MRVIAIALIDIHRFALFCFFLVVFAVYLCTRGLIVLYLIDVIVPPRLGHSAQVFFKAFPRLPLFPGGGGQTSIIRPKQ